MRRLITLVAAMLALPPTAAAAPPLRGAQPPTTAAPAASAALVRLLPIHAPQFTLRQLPRTGDHFTIAGRRGAITIEGTGPSVLLAGVGWYLKHVARVDLSWPGDSLSRLPAVLPAPAAPIRRSATVPHRFALNDTDDGYSGAYRDWNAYQRQVDLLALHGVNEVFVQMGAEAPYYEALKEFGHSGAQLRSWIPGPSHQPWWLMQNMSGFGGPVWRRLIQERAKLGRRIVARLHELGMTPVLPGYFGTVPPGFRHGRVVPQGSWVGFTRPDWLDPRTPAFADLAAAYYRHQKRLIGQTSMYKMDLLHEGGRPGDVPLPAAARAVFTALNTARPGATWVMLGWQNNPPTAIVDAIDHDRLLIVDGLSDRLNTLNREKTWRGAPYAFGTIPNFGGHTTIGANTTVWARFHQWRAKNDSALKGIAYLPEGTGTDPTTFELFTELAWHPGPLNHKQWFADYASRRYGGHDPHATAAWEALRQGPYSMPSGTWSEPQDGLFTARPSLTVRTTATWSPPTMRYDPATVRTALTELLQVSRPLRQTDAYRYDLVNTARQALANHSRELLPALKAAYDARDPKKFKAIATTWKSSLTLLDRLLATDSRFLLGLWLHNARAWGTTPKEKRRLEYDARTILTTWAHRQSHDAGSSDYANRELSGLVSTYYAHRWTLYLNTLEEALRSNTRPTPIDWFATAQAWTHQSTPHPTTPTGNPHHQATQVAKTLHLPPHEQPPTP
ncbi:alpha-N-acetylglucosaminidase [Spirillospora sp. CA-294931]|uniref:alpha-N-acetylglucosaminidase n=1 Tax=Spirillospora sp. CA-294931 TaxID=3240042 RepID=UPI003D8E87CD